MSRPARQHPQTAASARPSSHRKPYRNAGPHRSARPVTAPAAPPAPKYAWNEIPVEDIDLDALPSFRELGLPRGLAEALARRGINRPFPIQAAVISDVLAGRDVLGRAATGSGKTLAFGLPTLARLEGSRATARRPRALVLVPTRELAMQVCEALAPLAQARDLSVRLVAGGLSIGKQVDALVRGVDLLVATPGRLMDLMERGACRLDAIETTVLDEADHMADLGFLPAVRRILDATPAGGQRLLFSATLDGDVQTLVEQYLQDPAAHAVASATSRVDTMTHHVLRVQHAEKVDIAARIGARTGRTIMFVRTKHGADRLATQLGRLGVAAGALHGGRSQSQRTRALTAFKDGTVPVLVATDVAARGIHVDDVSLVVHVDPPADSKDYLHRSGRTARAGATGTVVMLTTPDQERAARRLLADATVQAAHRPVSADDADSLAELAEVTGAREPSGVPVVAPRPERAERSARPSSYRSDRPERSARPVRGERPVRAEHAAQTDRVEGADRSSRSDRPARSGGPSRHPQHADRRPRRDRRPQSSAR